MTTAEFNELKSIILPQTAPYEISPGVYAYESHNGIVFYENSRYIGAYVNGTFYYKKGATNSMKKVMYTYSMLYGTEYGFEPVTASR